MSEVPKPLDTALDLLVYAPVGLAITAAEELPKLVAKGRTRVHTQVMMARVVGRFAVARGRQELEKRFSPPGPPSTDAVAEPEPAVAVTFDEMTANGSAGTEAEAGPAGHPQGGFPGTERVEGGGEVTVSVSGDVAGLASEATPAGAMPAPRAADLAIPGYDSLSASQVVQRLAGLNRDELVAVGAYEQAHRGRRTILNRIDQLQER